MKKAVWLVVALVLVICCSVATADSPRTSGLFTYTLKGNGTAIITRFNWNENGNQDIYVPRLIDGYTVSEIGKNAFSSSGAGYTVSTYGSVSANTIYDHYKKTVGSSVVVVLPDTITVIGEKAFYCSKISAVTIPASCQFIGSGAFGGCENLSMHSVAPGNNVFATIDGVLYNKTSKELVSYPAGKKLDSFSVPDGITSIGDYAFLGVESRSKEALTIPSSVKRIGSYAFAFATIKNNVDFSSIEIIDDYAFYNSHVGERINLSSIRTIGKYAFSYSYFGCSRGSLSFSSSLEQMDEGAFDNCLFYNNDEVVIDLSNTKLKNISNMAFSESRFPEKIILPASLEYIGSRAFAGLWSRSTISITIPASVKTIADAAFQGTCFSGFSFDEGAALETIGISAFEDIRFTNSADKTISLPSKVQSIGSKAFYSKNIERLVIPKSVTEIGDVFCDRSATQLEVEPGSYAELYAAENGYGTTTFGGDDTSWLND